MDFPLGQQKNIVFIKSKYISYVWQPLRSNLIFLGAQNDPIWSHPQTFFPSSICSSRNWSTSRLHRQARREGVENLQVGPGVENPPFLDHFSERETMGFPYLFTVYRRVYKFGRIIHWNQQKNQQTHRAYRVHFRCWRDLGNAPKVCSHHLRLRVQVWTHNSGNTMAIIIYYIAIAMVTPLVMILW